MPKLQELIDRAPFQEAEEESLFLPSHFATPQARSVYDLQPFAPIEKALREGEAVDAIEDIKHSVKHTSVLVKRRQKQSSGVKMNLRSAKYIRATREKGQAWISKYQYARKCLINLGLSKADQENKFRVLEDADTYAANMKEMNELGQGSQREGWIWTVRFNTGATAKEQEEFEIEGAFLRI